jgi:hypothetical protein
MLDTNVLTLLGTLAVVTGPAAAEAPPTPPETPIVACTLDSAEKRERKAMLAREIVPHIQDVTERADGYVLWFDRAPGRIAALAAFVELESRCCAFLDFEIRLESGGDRIALELSGPAGTKEMLQPLIERRGAQK